jgi:transposase
MAPLPEKLAKVASLDAALARYTEAARAHNALLEEFLRQKEQLDWLKRQQFGTRSEKFIPTPEEQQALFAPGSAPENGGFSVTVTPVLDPGRALKTHRKTTESKGHGWGLLPDHLQREDILVPLTDEQKERLGEGSLVKIRDEVTERLAMRPQTLFVKRFIRPVFAAVEKDGARSVLVAPVPELPIEKKSRADLSLLIYLAVAKFLDHLPLDRIRRIYLRQGVKLQTSTLCTWMETFHDLLLPVYLAMQGAVKKESLIHTDDTVVRVVRSDKKHKTHKGRMWVYIGGGHFVYEYTPTRAGANPSRFLAGFTGTIQADGYAGYNEVAERPSVVRAGCHAHARRYFEKALPYFPEAEEMLLFYRSLFEIERNLSERGATPKERLEARQEHSRSLLSKMKAWMEERKKGGRVLPQSALGKAIEYALSRWETLEAFLEDGNIPLSNNISERAMRGVVLGRNNYMFFGSETAARQGAVFYSLLHSCVCLGINPEEYLADIAPRIGDHMKSRLVELTPAGWLAARNHPSL